MIKVLFVCTGNTCRSPMAEAYLKHLLEKQGLSGNFHVESCGVYAASGIHASEGSINRMKKEGIDLTHHQSQPINQQLIDESHFIFCMSFSHEQVIKKISPQAAEKIHVLDVSDPVGLSQSVYDQCFQDIVQSLEEYLPMIMEHAHD